MSFGAYNLIKRVELCEDYIKELELSLESYETIINFVRGQMLDTYARLIEVDSCGSFESDDEGGFIFKDIKELVSNLNDKIKSIYE